MCMVCLFIIIYGLIRQLLDTTQCLITGQPPERFIASAVQKVKRFVAAVY